MDENHENSDEDFKEFLKNQNSNSDSLAEWVVATSLAKMDILKETFRISMDSYLKLSNEDPLKKDIGEFSKNMSQEINYVIRTIDYVVMRESDEYYGDDEENE